jgi:hypothetical protein
MSNFVPETPEEFELAWQAQNPEGDIHHVEVDEDMNIESVDTDPYDDDED